MDPKRFDQVSVDRSLFGEQSRWLCDGMEVTLSLLKDGVPVSGTHSGHPPDPRCHRHESNQRDLAGVVPAIVTLEVATSGVFVKGDTSGSALIPCTLENGVQPCGNRAAGSSRYARWFICETTALNFWIGLWALCTCTYLQSPLSRGNTQLTLAHCTDPVDIPSSPWGRSPSHIKRFLMSSATLALVPAMRLALSSSGL